MKKFAKIFTAIVVAFAAYSCAADATEDLAVQIGGDKGQATITLSFEELTKVQLGDKKDGVYPLYWSEGDQISVNGVASNELTGVGKKATEATFVVEGVSYPWNIVYPAAVGEAVEGSYPVAFPAEQEYVAGNVDPKAVVLYGYATEPAEGAAVASVALNHLTGVLQLNVKGAVTLTDLTVTAKDGNIAGSYTVNCETGELAEVEASNIVTMTFGDGLALNEEEATPIYVAVPAGSHGAVWVTLRTADDKMTVKFDSANKPISAGKVREFKEFTYAANNTHEDSEVFEIDGVDKLLEFAGKANKFFPLTKAVLTTNLTWPADQTWTPIEGFGAFEFDGGGYKITGLNAPLFNETYADIHDLTLENVTLNITDNGNSGAFARRIINGSLVNCHATGTSTINCAEYDSPETINSYSVYAHGGLVGFVDGVVLDNCTNGVAITIQCVYAGKGGNTSRKTAIGGIAGSHVGLSSFTNLTNTGAITYTGTTQSTTMYISGIVGRDVEAKTIGDKHVAALHDCTNKGNITTNSSSKSIANVYISGITGYLLTTNDITVYNLHNEGSLLYKGDVNGKEGLAKDQVTAGIYLGGIVGNVAQAHFKDCTNSGNIEDASGTNAARACMAGIVISLSEDFSLDNCDNSGLIRMYGVELTQKLVDESDYPVLGGVVAMAGGDTTIVNCDNTGEIHVHSQSPELTPAITVGDTTTPAVLLEGPDMFRIGGVIGQCNAKTVTDCTNGGAFNIRSCQSGINIGGVIGIAIRNGATISGCKNTAKINAASNGVLGGPTAGSDALIGGVIGNAINNITITGCENSGQVTCEYESDAKVNTYKGTLYFGGIIGGCDPDKTISISNCTNSGAVSNQQFKSEGVIAGIGGIIGKGGAATISGCTNHTGSITQAGQNTYTDVCIGGIVGVNVKSGAVISGCTNSSTVGTSKRCGKLNYVCIGGICGKNNQTITIQDCENAQTAVVTYTSTTSDKYEYPTCIGGILGAGTDKKSSIISGCTNNGTINYSGKKTNTSKNAATGVGGIVGYAHWGISVENCTNGETAVVGGKGTNVARMGFGGIVGYAYRGNVNISECKNYGTIQQTATALPAGKDDTLWASGNGFGGILGIGAQAYNVSDCDNYGTISIANTTIASDANLARVYVGGVIGWGMQEQNNNSSGGNYTYCALTMKNLANYADLTFTGAAGKYYAGGVIGCITTNESNDNKRYWQEISGLKNVADLTFTGVNTDIENGGCQNYAFGGVVGFAEAKELASSMGGEEVELTGCVFYGNLDAEGKANVGAILGCEYSAAGVVMAAQLGGHIKKTLLEEGVDASGDAGIVETPVDTDIDDSNLATYIYSAVVEDIKESVYLPEQPAVPGNQLTE